MTGPLAPLFAQVRDGWFVPCSTPGHEGITATHKAIWTTYGGGLRSRKLCEQCASRGRGQRGLRIETLPSFRGVHESGGMTRDEQRPGGES